MAFRPAYFGGDKMSVAGGLSRHHMFSPPSRLGRDDSQYMHGGFGEMEGIVERERQKFKEVRQGLENQLDMERKTRIDFQNKLIKLKDEFAKKELVISELEFRENNILHENQDVAVENEKLRTELGRLEEMYSSRIYELEGQLASERKQLQETTEQYNSEYEKFKKTGQEYIESLTFEYDRKIKALEDKLKAIELNRKDLAFDNKRLNELLTQSKMNFEEEVRELTSRMRDEEQKKMQLLTKSFEQRLRSSEQAKESLNRKCQQYLKVVQDKDRELEARQHENHGEVERLQQEVSELNNRNAQLDFLLNKLRNEIQERDSVLKRYSGESTQQTFSLRQQLDSRRKQNQTLNQTVRQLRQNLKEIGSDAQRKRLQLAERLNYAQNQARRYKDQYTKLHMSLKSKINETINNFSSLHRS